MKLWNLLGVLWLSFGTSGAMAANVLDPATGLTWRQVTDTQSGSLSWNAVASVCDATTGVCSGSLGSVSYEGWTWASVADVNKLFTNFGIPGFTGTSPAEFAAAVNDTIWATNFLNAFAPTQTSIDRMVYGFLRDDLVIVDSGLEFGSGYSAVVYDVTFGQRGDGAASNRRFDKSGGTTLGAWLYQPTAVPEPSTYALMLAGLGLLGFMARRRRQ